MQNKDLSQSVNLESERLKDKYQIIKIQQDSIENLKQQLEKLKEEQKNWSKQMHRNSCIS